MRKNITFTFSDIFCRAEIRNDVSAVDMMGEGGKVVQVAVEFYVPPMKTTAQQKTCVGENSHDTPFHRGLALLEFATPISCSSYMEAVSYTHLTLPTIYSV